MVVFLRHPAKRTGGVLIGFLMFNLDKNFTEASNECFLLFDIISKLIRNHKVLPNSSKRLKGQKRL